MDIIALSGYIVNQFSQHSPDGITPMKLQKLLYYIKVWTTVAERELVSASFEHWDYGPVNREVYDFYRNYGKAVIDPSQLDDVHIDTPVDTPEKDLINFIVENYIKFDAFTLSAMTHTEEPWKQTNRNDIISNDLIRSYYREQYFANNFQPFDLSSNEFYPLNNYSFIIDMAEKDAGQIIKYSSYEAYKHDLREAEQKFDMEWLSLSIS